MTLAESKQMPFALEVHVAIDASPTTVMETSSIDSIATATENCSNVWLLGPG